MLNGFTHLLRRELLPAALERAWNTKSTFCNLRHPGAWSNVLGSIKLNKSRKGFVMG
jgi:hypothetical protein